MKMFDAGKTRMIGLPYGEKNYDDMLSRFRLIPERYGPPDGRTHLLYQYRASVCVSMLTRDKNHDFRPISGFISSLMQDKAIITTEGE